MRRESMASEDPKKKHCVRRGAREGLIGGRHERAERKTLGESLVHREAACLIKVLRGSAGDQAFIFEGLQSFLTLLLRSRLR
jgi:hypothetical protein